jgi:hypothetical protein
MLRNLCIATLMGLGFALSALPGSAQYVYVQVGPPAPVYETVPASPGAGYVWVGGYYTYEGGRYVWRHGYYAHHAGHWCAGAWHHNHHGYYWSEGRWC